jgi:hypothetical protein
LYGLIAFSVGVPLTVKILPDTEPNIPAGKPFKKAPVAEPFSVNKISVIGWLKQIV